MLKRRVLAGFFSGLLILALPVEAEWSGYINEKVPVKYGFMSTPGLNAESGHLRLVCVAGSTFQILPDTRNAKEPYGNTVLVSVDSLPATEFSLTRLGDDYSIDHQEPAFWKLIAQMAAGANILVETGPGMAQRYSLKGFTVEFKKHCSWIDSAFRYQKFLALYR